MNIDKIKATIAIMERAKPHDAIRMASWQEGHIYGCPVEVSESSLHACGNKACLAGYVAVSPEWQMDGGTMHSTGEPYIASMPVEKWDAGPALAQWWGVSETVGELLVLPYTDTGLGDGENHVVYGKHWMDVRVDDVLRVLNELLEIGEDAFLEKYRPCFLPR